MLQFAIGPSNPIHRQTHTSATTRMHARARDARTHALNAHTARSRTRTRDGACLCTRALALTLMLASLSHHHPAPGAG